ncbi:hypothetical protein [Intestinimonas butyriciproducens]|uniref:Uncharacterized protein n=1 Tax=Intestinimonas butyriciproducens TaxID=1297617 RepID=A0A2U1CCH0_9FIRM|nr:hypothetical protein [Intestinimonas butyriciproducens]MCR1906079.1 hypothetical protein [Intestinimonas butyriciproducens]MDY3019885.1 hypothetical protein [Oscillospiraceae bacterium]PVY58612.1 hypothetical protein C7373_104210 [Intestinimonas butyriciproducens]QBB65636.1 hypothetical protein SRB521_01374 [Intestinimonas butyriciproducens]
MKNTYKIDFVNNTLAMSKAFEEATNNPASEEYKLLKQLRADFPGLTITRKTRRAPKKARPTKNLTYKHMEQYMSVFKNAGELLAQFDTVKRCSLGQNSPYKFVREWFEAQFPKYKELPDFGNNALKVIDFPTSQKKQEEKKEQGEQLEKKDA